MVAGRRRAPLQFMVDDRARGPSQEHGAPAKRRGEGEDGKNGGDLAHNLLLSSGVMRTLNFESSPMVSLNTSALIPQAPRNHLSISSISLPWMASDMPTPNRTIT